MVKGQSGFCVCRLKKLGLHHQLTNNVLKTHQISELFVQRLAGRGFHREDFEKKS